MWNRKMTTYLRHLNFSSQAILFEVINKKIIWYKNVLKAENL